MLVEALAAGGEDAALAAYCLTTKVCNDDSDRSAAFRAFVMSPEMHDPERVMG